MYRIVTGVTSDVCVPSTYLVVVESFVSFLNVTDKLESRDREVKNSHISL